MSDRVYFKHLFQPGKIGKLEIKNRVVMPAMSSVTHATIEGFASPLTVAYYEARARGGVGLIMVGSLCVDFPVGVSGKPRLTIHEDQYIPKLSEVVAAIHKHGAKALAQLHHSGNAAVTAPPPVAPSAIMRRACYLRPIYFMPRELTTEEIPRIVDKWGKAAGRAQKAGFDGIEIHAGHRYLINEFLSPYWNRRKDQYGGSLENRARFLLEIIAAIRKTCGADFPIVCRINGAEYDIEGGMSHAEYKLVAQMVEKAGVDALHISCISESGEVASPADPPGFDIPLAASIKKKVNIPVIAVGRISPALGDKTLREGKADFIAIGRGLLADPELANKAAAGRVADITPCLGCDSCLAAPKAQVSPDLVEAGHKGDAGRECAVNAGLLMENYVYEPARKSRKVLVIGGGPGGMEAARVAALRGHQVTLYEKETMLGGQVALASLLRADDEPLVKYLSGQLKKLGVKVELCKEATPAMIVESKPEAVVLATGCSSVLPDIPGVDKPNVISSAAIYEMMHGRFDTSAVKRKVKNGFVMRLGAGLMKSESGLSLLRTAMNFWLPFGQRVVVVGRGLAGIELADFLVEKGRKVVVVDTREELPFGEPPMAILRQFMEWRLGERGVPIVTVTALDGVGARGLTVVNKKGQLQTIEADNIVFTGNSRPRTELAEALAGKTFEVHQVGDCVNPLGILEAIRDGNRVGRAL